MPERLGERPRGWVEPQMRSATGEPNGPEGSTTPKQVADDGQPRVENLLAGITGEHHRCAVCARLFVERRRPEAVAVRRDPPTTDELERIQYDAARLGNEPNGRQPQRLG